MNAYELLDALGGIDNTYIEEASKAGNKNGQGRWIKWGATAACLCIAAMAAIILLPPRGASDAGQSKIKNHVYHSQGAQSSDTDLNESGGVFIPAIELPDNAGEADMIGLVVYKGGIYTQSESYYDDDARRVESLVGEYLGMATGKIDEWSTQDEYAHEFASTFYGEVYAVNGYGTDFRVCLRQEVEGENGEPTLWIEFMDRLNGISLASGEDLFENRLHLRGRVDNIQWQSHDDWNWSLGNFRNAELEAGLWEKFLDEVDKGEFVYTWRPSESFYEDIPNSSIYDNPNQAHLTLNMDDGTTVRLRLIEGGYVGYGPLGWYFVKIPGEIFDAVYDACGGTHLTE